MPDELAQPTIQLRYEQREDSVRASLFAVAATQGAIAIYMLIVRLCTKPPEGLSRIAATRHDVVAIATLASAGLILALAAFADKSEKITSIAATGAYTVALVAYVWSAIHSHGTGVSIGLGITNIAIIAVLAQAVVSSDRPASIPA